MPPSFLATYPPPPPDPWNLQRPRFCLLSREEQKNFGFHLLYQLGKADHVVYRVDPGSSAQRHGLREGDRILAVNNNIVDHEDYAMVRLARDSLWNEGTFHSTSERKRSLTFTWAL